jgi:pimeloyl-ACP methyl ester carboxylesterase
MPFATVDGIRTRYDVLGSGPPLLLFSPGGFNATIENWRSFGIYQRLNLLDHLSAQFTCVVFDKRESGKSGGRLEQIEWRDYAAQGAALLDHLGIERGHVMGGCIGCSIALTLAVTHPGRVSSLVLYSPAGGPHYRMTQQARFTEHAEFARAGGLAGVVELARAGDRSFAQDPRLGPWASVLRSDDAFAAEYAAWDVNDYVRLVIGMMDGLFDRDTAPGPEPEELMTLAVPALVVPGRDRNHAISAARYLEECLPRSEYWDAAPEEQTEETAPRRVLDFLAVQSSDSPRSSAAI